MAKITVDLDITKQELKDKQEFVEAHEFKLLGMSKSTVIFAILCSLKFIC